MTDAGFIIAGYVVTAAVLVAYVAWMAWRFQKVRTSMSDEEIEQAREPRSRS